MAGLARNAVRMVQMSNCTPTTITGGVEEGLIH